MSSLPSATPTCSLKPTDCPPESRSCPTCPTGYTCRLNVVDSCQCPTASCVKINFDTDSGSIDNDASGSPSEHKSVLAPVLGAVAGILLVIAIALFYILRQRRRRMARSMTLDQEGQAGGYLGHSGDKEELNDEESKGGWRGSLNEAKRQKDIIRVTYPTAPNGSARSSRMLAELGSPQAPFAQEEGGRKKHASLVSNLSTGILDEAVKMVMNTKAKPKIMRLNMVKTNNKGMIQRSNSLHSNNSLKRSASQRRIREANAQGSHSGQQGIAGDKEELPDSDQSSDETDHYGDGLPLSGTLRFTPAVMITAPSTRSSAQSMLSTKRKPDVVLEPRPLHPSYHVKQSSPKPKPAQSSPVAEPTLEPASTTPTSAAASPSTSSPNLILPSVLVEPPSEAEESQPPQSSSDAATSTLDPVQHDANGQKLQSSNLLLASRSSTFSAASDLRSTATRGDGEEITIFWDGKRDSNVAP
ncbi:hypothetical protein BGX34_008854 [Mortierella sp. NVP85]|nr:hypothetical protein BGX34_008854 [Mortierella sp. NVP85]